MIFNIRGDKLEVTNAIKEYVEEKLSRLNKYYDNSDDINCRVVVRVRNNKQTVEVTIPLNKFILRAEVSDDDLYAAIDLVVDKLEGQIRKNKTRLKNRYDKVEEPELNFDFETEDEDDLDSIESGMSSSNPFNLNFDKIEKKNFKEIPYDNNNIFMDNDISFHHEKSNDFNENMIGRNDSQFFKFKFLDDNF